MTSYSILVAILMTLGAGLATGLGGATVFFSKKLKPSFLAISLGFSAGVMIYVSMIEIFPKARESLMEGFSESIASIITVIAFFVGMFLIMLIDVFIPESENPHEWKDLDDMPSHDEGRVQQISQKKLLRMGVLSALAIGIHNFPEGLATFMSAIHDPQLGISIAIAIAIHNIPEGVAVAVPVYYATQSRRKAFSLSLLSGLAEPIGGLIGFLIISIFALQTGTTNTIFGIVFAAVAGIMVYISLDELLPTAEKYGKHHYAIGGVISGMALMASSLLLFG